MGLRAACTILRTMIPRMDMMGMDMGMDMDMHPRRSDTRRSSSSPTASASLLAPVHPPTW
jgi:hypothetical protein